jgi:ABC-type uncharacterized transport system
MTNPQQPQGPQGSSPSSPDTTMTVLAVGTALGLVVLATGAVLVYYFWSVFSGGMEVWRANWWKVGLTVLALFGGLAILFGALQYARPEERTQPTLRRLLYGYNAVLSGILLLAILVVVNLLAYVPFWPFTAAAAPYDWTASHVYSLSPASREVLQRLDKRVHVYVLMPAEASLKTQEIQTLLANTRAYTNKIDWETISPQQQPRATEKLVEKYQIGSAGYGVLIVSGEEGKEQWEYAKDDDLFTVNRSRPGEGDRLSVTFKGENAIISKIQYLVDNKTKPVVYFAQGYDELPLNPVGRGREGESVGSLRDKLQRGSYDVKEWKINQDTTEVPEDAAVVVIARPQSPYPPKVLDALRNYMNGTGPSKKKGKLVVLLDVIPSRKGGGGMEPTLESFLAEFNVQVQNERVLCLNFADPLNVLVTGAREARGNPLAAKFRGYEVLFHDARPVRPQQANPAAPLGGAYQAETVLATSPRVQVLTEPNLSADPAALIASLEKPEREKDLLARLSPEPIPLGVVVTEPAPTNPNDPHAGLGLNRVPRMVVVGDATWASDEGIEGPRGQLSYELFSAALAYLRDRPDLGTLAEDKVRKPYLVKGDSFEVFRRLALIPGPVLAFAIVGLGLGVWIVRRR